ncbi:hypothetical protein [Methylobacterium frigidaeris]|uniref:Uncharacterized protein n=1 Tax=Methylobacterium frigidaeris TaxID=2038277 RepID=A0AA37HDV7_9HYPH|nr:hypothetical protein [Methylobacterium frigidaeris]GJD63739.1 hypothetical protein MPEAHAMD_3910 [Methylobacterium frigidaeris]
MPTQILSILPRRQDLRTSASEDWTDAFPLVRAGPAAIVAGVDNRGNGTLVVSGVAAYAELGPHLVTVTSATGGVFLFSVTAPGGAPIGRGMAGVPVTVGGLTLTLTPGDVPFVAGDAWGVQPTAQPIDDTGIEYVLQIRQSQASPVVTLEAASQAPSNALQTLIPGRGTGVPTLLVLAAAMAPARFPPGSYVYELLALADGRRKSAYFGNLEHVDGVAYLP